MNLYSRSDGIERFCVWTMNEKVMRLACPSLAEKG